MEALKVGALKIGESVLGAEKPFQRFIPMTYDSKIETKETEDHDIFKTWIQQVKARGSTDFKKTFDWIQNFVKSTNDLKDITIIFFTDG